MYIRHKIITLCCIWDNIIFLYQFYIEIPMKDQVV